MIKKFVKLLRQEMSPKGENITACDYDERIPLQSFQFQIGDYCQPQGFSPYGEE
ncbi:MAG: hypothetical protein QMD71_00930 [bacterium]|nr:hypothetical protein [bacterium]